MWIATPRGFYSVVEHRDDVNRMIVRARARQDLENLASLAEGKLAPGWPGSLQSHIQSTPEADYPFRLEVTRTVWMEMLLELGREIDYDNFKNAVKERQGKDRARTYMGVWSALRKIEWEGREPEEYTLPMWDEDDEALTRTEVQDMIAHPEEYDLWPERRHGLD